MKKILILTVAILLSGNFLYAETIVDIKKIIGKNGSDVAKYLGNPISCSKSKYGQKCQYQKAETEIVFIGMKADWITIEGVNHLPFSKNILKSLGLKISDPTFQSSSVIRWERIQGIQEISLFKGSSKSDYIYIKAKTK